MQKSRARCCHGARREITLILQISVASSQHGRKTCRLFFAPAFFTGFFEMPMAAHNAQRAFAVELLLQSTQGFLDGFAFLQFDISQNMFTSLPGTSETAGFWPGVSSLVRGKDYGDRAVCQPRKQLQNG